MACPANRVLETLGAPEIAAFSAVEKHLLNDFQRGFPVVERPFGEIAGRLEVSEQQVLEMLERFQASGLVSRVGPVFSPNSVGRSTLAAMAVPERRLDEVAAIVSGFAEINHNYERNHRFNLWFVVTARDQGHLDHVIERIEQMSGLPVMSLPMLESYHLDLGFPLEWDDRGRENADDAVAPDDASVNRDRVDISTDAARRLIAAIQHGLPLVERPYAAIAGQAGLDEAEVMDRLRLWQQARVINRFGVILRHRKLGFRANAMVVWDVPDDQVAELGRCFSRFDFVTLCYRRPRRLPQWPYNLFCMIHGRDHDAVLARIATLGEQCVDGDIPHEVLFSHRCFKQRGARYHDSDATPGRKKVVRD